MEWVIEWLVQNNEEFRECIRQLFRLQYKVEGCAENWEEWQEPYRQKADVFMNRINDLLEQYRASVTA